MFDKILFGLIYLLVHLVDWIFLFIFSFVDILLFYFFARKDFFSKLNFKIILMIFLMYATIFFFMIYFRGNFFPALFSLMNITTAVVTLIRIKFCHNSMAIGIARGIRGIRILCQQQFWGFYKEIHCLKLNIELRACDQCPYSKHWYRSQLICIH